MLECTTLSWSSCCYKESSIVQTSAITRCRASRMVRTSTESCSFSSSLDCGASLVLLRVFSSTRFSYSRTDTTKGSSSLDVSLGGR